MYAIAQLVQNELTARRWRKSDLVAAMGYRNVTRGLKRLAACLNEGDCTQAEFITRMRQALELPQHRISAAVGETRRQQAENQYLRQITREVERRARFRPYVFVRTSETRPSMITAAAAIGPRLKYLHLDDDMLTLSCTRLIAVVGEMVREHCTENLGRCLLFGHITGYAFRIAYDATVVYDVAGSVLAEIDGWHEEEGHAELSVGGGQPIREGLFDVA